MVATLSAEDTLCCNKGNNVTAGTRIMTLATRDWSRPLEADAVTLLLVRDSNLGEEGQQGKLNRMLALFIKC